MRRRRICAVTGSRAEYGLLYWVLQELRTHVDVELQIIATGMHLAPEHGETVRQIEADGFHVDRRVDMLLSSDRPGGVAKSIGLGVDAANVTGATKLYQKVGMTTVSEFVTLEKELRAGKTS